MSIQGVLYQVVYLYLLFHQSAELQPEGLGKFLAMPVEFGRRETADVSEIGCHVCKVIIPAAPCDIG